MINQAKVETIQFMFYLDGRILCVPWVNVKKVDMLNIIVSNSKKKVTNKKLIMTKLNKDMTCNCWMWFDLN